MKKLVVIIVVFLMSCNGGIKDQTLLGKWNYVSYQYQNKSLNKPLANIAIQKPYIIFNADGTAAIYSSGKVLSSGNYKLDGKIIRFVEDLPKHQQRKIPFLIQELSDTKLIFQTMDAEVKIITALKHK